MAFQHDARMFEKAQLRCVKMLGIENIYLTTNDLLNWSGKKIFGEGRALFEAGRVQKISASRSRIDGVLGYGDRMFRTSFEVKPDGTVENMCPCKDSRERGIICMHVIAVALAWLDRISDPRKDRAMRIERRLAQPAGRAAADGFVPFEPVEKESDRDATLYLKLSEDWESRLAEQRVVLTVQVEAGGTKRRIDKLARDRVFHMSPRDVRLIYILEDMLHGRPAAGKMILAPEQLAELFYALMPDGAMHVAGSSDTINVLDEVVQPDLHVKRDGDSGCLRVEQRFDLPACMGDGAERSFVLGRRFGFILSGGYAAPLDALLPEHMRSLYDGAGVIRGSKVPKFILNDLPEIEPLMLIDSEVTEEDLRLSEGTPVFRLDLGGQLECMTCSLFVRYEQSSWLPAGQHEGIMDMAFPQKDAPYSYYTRSLEVEEQGIQELIARGIKGADGTSLEEMTGVRNSLNFLAKDVPQFRSLGWDITFSGGILEHMQHVHWIHPEVEIKQSRAGWFDVLFHYGAAEGEPVELDVERVEDALLMDEAYYEEGDDVFLLDTGMIRRVNGVFDDCAVRNEIPHRQLTVSDIHAGYIMSSLNMIPNLNVRADEYWKMRVAMQNGKKAIEERPLSARMDGILRGYQKEGVYWLRYLEESGICGILADEMGLGKTIQTLAWIEMNRASASAQGLPSLIVCPTSLVENWAAESTRFSPELRIAIMAGATRHKLWDELQEYDLVITSYALIRRDVPFYCKQNFAIAVLDEAQHIKNHSTQNARSTKKIKAMHRLVLTGTPIENSVTDLWSIMDFLMPGYLGTHQQFRYVYEMPIVNRNADAASAQERLRRKVHPFLMRRLKIDVAKDLPPKIERVAVCRMTPDQERVYSRLLSDYRNQVYDMVREQGFDKSRFAIFRTLLRLRQACCHLSLLKDESLKMDEPSGKLELFHELLDEALDGGNRILVFSQFVSMLRILKTELEKRKLKYSYLDGSTKNRLEIVNNFNNSSDIPVFLISLKAGGTGLNLTGADTVIHFDPWWNPAVEDQATDRAHRIGQKRTVYSVKLITKDSVEEKVLAMQQRKREIIDATLATEAQGLDKVSWEDIQELFRE